MGCVTETNHTHFDATKLAVSLSFTLSNSRGLFFLLNTQQYEGVFFFFKPLMYCMYIANFDSYFYSL